VATAHDLRRAWIVVAAGLTWAQLSIWLVKVVAPTYLRYGDLVAQGMPYRVASWTLLAPLTLAERLSGDPFVALLSSSLLAVGACTLASAVLAMPRWRIVVVWALAASCALGAASITCVALQFRDTILAENAFFALVGRADPPHKDAAVVGRARAFVDRHPDSRWCGEALRIVAMAEWDAGRIDEAAELWRRFETRFRDPLAPGVAYAEFSQALCDERLGRSREAEAHLKNAISVIRARKDGIQAWVARDSAMHLATLERSSGFLAEADYWKTKSLTFSDVYSIQ
jgi:hypothetical protein